MSSHYKRVRHFLEIALFLVFSLASFAQESTVSQPSSSQDAGDSLAAAARRSKAQKSRAKKVVTEDDLEAASGPLPHMKMEGPENADDIIAAITKYKQTHTPEQTEEAVRAWYDRYDDELAAAIQDNLDIQSLREANASNGYELCQQSHDYQKCENRRIAEGVVARQDQSTIRRNTGDVTRIQHSFMKVRNGLMQMGLRYDWFKVRTTNNTDRF
jgi:hypothetical protein